MKLDFRFTGTKTYAVLADGEQVGNLIKGIGKHWMFINRADFLGFNPRVWAEIRTGVADQITLLNVTDRLTS